MGTRMAPSYAIIFMDHLEQQFLSTQTLQPMVWWCYIDDIFLIWTYSESELQTFFENLNQYHPTIKFTSDYSPTEAIFLDTRVYLKDGHIQTDLYTKPTDTHQYLDTRSCHPRHCKTAIPYSQALRLRRICSEEMNFKKRLKELNYHLRRRGYKDEDLSAIQRASEINRQSSLQPKQRGKETRIPLVATYHPSLPSFNKVLTSKHPILHACSKLKEVLPDPPLVAYRRPKNLRDLLVKANVASTTKEPPGNYRCGSSRCKTCPALLTTKEFVSHITGEKHLLKNKVTCKSSNVIYMIQCALCGQQYVGETGQPLHARMNNHRAYITQKRESGTCGCTFQQSWPFPGRPKSYGDREAAQR